MNAVRKTLLVASLSLLATSLAACSDNAKSQSTAKTIKQTLPQSSEPVQLNPADFSTTIDNPYWPMSPGSKWVYREDGGKRVVVTVTDKTKKLANGIEAVVVHDVVTNKNRPVEVTDDWYAQDKQGNIWYLGEDTAEYKNGKPVNHSGSFEAGVDGAQPGIAMPADPRPGQSYRQEYYKGEAEDKAAIVSVGEEMVTVPFGFFDNVVMTRDLVPLEPEVQELKFYGRGVGPLLALKISGGSGREELTAFTPGRGSR